MASILLPVPQILQNPELPNGCEITSCCEVTLGESTQSTATAESGN